MALPKLEDFAGSGDFDLLTIHDANWVSTNAGWRTVSEAAFASGTGYAAWTGDTFNDDQFAEGVIDSLDASRRIGVAVHIDAGGSDDGYYLRGNTTNVIGGETVSGTETDTSGSGSAPSATDVLRLEVTVSGSTATLTPFVNSVEITAITPWTSTAHTSGDAGMSTNNGSQNARLDDWEGGNLAAGVSIIVQSLTQSQSIDQPSLTQANILAANDLDQSQSIDQPDLTQANTLITNDIDQTQSIDSPILTQAHILSVNDITQSQSIDNITLVVAGALLVDGLTQSQTIDLANIIQSHILSVNGLSQVQTIDEPSLIAGITVNDITQTQSLDNITLIQANILNVDDLTQSQIIDNVLLGGLVIGFHKGEVLVFSAYNGIITSTNAHTGEVKVFNAVDIT